MEITERVAYLRGLMEGLALDTESKEGKILAVMADILDDMSLELQDQQDQLLELSEGLDAVSDDLEDVEDIIYDDDDEDELDDDEDDDCYATTCPTCEETIYFDEDILEDGEVVCPNCGEKLAFDLSCAGTEDEDPE